MKKKKLGKNPLALCNALETQFPFITSPEISQKNGFERASQGRELLTRYVLIFGLKLCWFLFAYHRLSFEVNGRSEELVSFEPKKTNRFLTC